VIPLLLGSPTVLGVTSARNAADVLHNDDGRPFLVGKVHIY
jgi:hypothetical protein